MDERQEPPIYSRVEARQNDFHRRLDHLELTMKNGFANTDKRIAELKISIEPIASIYQAIFKTGQMLLALAAIVTAIAVLVVVFRSGWAAVVK